MLSNKSNQVQSRIDSKDGFSYSLHHNFVPTTTLGLTVNGVCKVLWNYGGRKHKYGEVPQKSRALQHSLCYPSASLFWHT